MKKYTGNACVHFCDNKAPTQKNCSEMNSLVLCQIKEAMYN